MAALAIHCRIDVPFLFQSLSDLGLRELLFLRPILPDSARHAVFGDELSWFYVLWFPVEIKNLVFGSQEIFRVPMAFQTPGHAVGFGMINHWHPIDFAMTAKTADAAIHVGGVIVEDIIGRAMDLHPLNRFATLPTVTHWLELRIILLHLRVAVHARLRGRQIRVGRHFDKTVAIAAIHPQLSHVNVMRKRHRLNRLISDARVFRRYVIPSCPGQSESEQHRADRHLQRQPIRPARKKVRHKISKRDRDRAMAAGLTTNQDCAQNMLRSDVAKG